MNIIALGAESNTTVSHFLGDEIITSGPFGDTSFVENFQRMKEYVQELFSKHDFDVILVDAHPAFHSYELAKNLGKPLVSVQHHRAHIYSVAHEHGLSDFIGIAADGLGYGDDGTLWGGEVFHNTLRIGRLEQQQQLGGDTATMKPAKMLFSILSRILEKPELAQMMTEHFSDAEIGIFFRQLEDKYNTPLTSSCGRVLDSASVLLGFCREMNFSGEPAILLQDNSTEPYDLEPVITRDEMFILETTPLFRFLVNNMDLEKGRLAATVQAYLALGFLRIAKTYNPGLPVVFSGGCAKNKIMSEIMKGNGVLMNSKVDSGDAGISYGQIAYYLANAKV